MGVEIRVLRKDDLPFARRQLRRVGWVTCRGRLEAHLEHDPEGCFLAEVDGRPVGMVTSTAYTASGWIGNLVVDPDHRRQGLGNLLAVRALEHLCARGLTTTRLDADPPGVSIYLRLGFRDEHPSLRYVHRRRPTFPSSVSGVESFRTEEVPVLSSLDRPAFGDDRLGLLRLLAMRAELRLLARRDDGDLAGYLMASPTTDGRLHLGPLIADGSRTARDLLGCALSRTGDRMLSVGVPSSNRAACALIEEVGFQPAPASRRMVWGGPGAEGDPRRVFAIGGGAIG